LKYKTLNNDWKLISSNKINVDGDKITSINYDDNKWMSAVVPGSVVSSLVKNNIFADPYYNRNIIELPGYKVGKNSLFSNHYMPDDSPFRDSWWYRKRFSLDSYLINKNIKIKFLGLNYKANIWLNRKRIATTTSCSGAYRIYEFNLNNLYFDRDNVLAVEIIAPQVDDLGITFIDWNPVPPDDSMGIWQPVTLEYYNEISINNTYITSKIDFDNETAELSLITELNNQTNNDKRIRLNGTIYSDNNKEINFNKELIIQPKVEEEINLTVEEIPELKIKNPDLWWPYQLGKANLYELEVKITEVKEDSNIEPAILDQENIKFGIREINSYLNDSGSRTFVINNQEVQIRGAAWTSDLMLRQSKTQDQIDINYLKNLNFNTVRLEGKLASKYFWDLCNKEGILVIAGWPCCNHWEKWEKWKDEDLEIAKSSTESQLKRLRKQPAFAAWFYGSDFPPPLEVEREYLKVINDCQLKIPLFSSAADKEASLTGKPGVKMSGPYSYVPPQYWYDKKMPGKAGKFNTETGPDMCLPEYDSLKKFIKKSELEIGSKSWNLHTGLSEFDNTAYLEEIINKRFSDYSTALKKPENFVKAAQFVGYQSWRAMYESHMINWPHSTGVIGWMLNSAWPSLIWQLYDYYNLPNGAFYGSKKGSELLHLIFNYNDQKVYLVNQKNKKCSGLQAELYLYNSNLDLKYSNQLDLNPVNKMDKLEIDKLSSKINAQAGVLFLYLKKEDQLISKNVYFLPEGKDVYCHLAV